MNIHAAAAYAAHLLTARSTTGHGVHSPLMFRFITEVIEGSADKHIMAEVRSLRREMLYDNRVVRVTDLGAGSVSMGRSGSSIFRAEDARAMLTDSGDAIGGAHTDGHETITGDVLKDDHTAEPLIIERSISRIAAVAALPSREAGLLARMAQSLEYILTRDPALADPGRPEKESNRPVILELGTSLGISTLALALGAPYKRIVTVEGCPELAAIARENLRRHGADNAEVLNMEFSQALIYLRSLGTKVEMVFIDGNHRGTALTEYANTVRRMGDEMIIVADDIHLNRDMIRAWKSLYKGPLTTRPAGGTRAQSRQRQAAILQGAPSSWIPTEKAPGVMPTFSSPSTTSLAMASLETFRLGMLFCLLNLTPGHYRIRY